MQQRNLLLALGDISPRELVKVALNDDGTTFHVCERVSEIKTLLSEVNDLDAALIADSLEDCDLITAIRLLRDRTRGPLIIIGAGDSVPNEIAAYQEGADDVLAGSVDPVLLLAKVKAHLRRTKTSSSGSDDLPPVLYFAGLELDLVRRELRWADGAPINLTSTEFELLRVFACRPHTPLSRDDLISALRGRPLSGYERAVDMLVRRLRQKIENDPRRPALIKTIRGIGYLLATEVSRSARTSQ